MLGLAEMSLLRESWGGKQGETPALWGSLTGGWGGGVCALGVCSGPGWGRTGPGIISPPPGYEDKQVWPLWFLKEGTQRGRAIEIETRWSFDLSVQEAEGRKSVLFQAFTMSHCHPSSKCAKRRGCSQVLDFL